MEEAEVEIAERLACLDRPRKSISAWDFFMVTQEVLGMSSPVGFAMCREMGILCESKKNQWGLNETLPHADWRGKGYFTIRTNEDITVPEKKDGRKTGNCLAAKGIVTKLTPDHLDKDGNVVKQGGFKWLLDKLYNDERCLLYRLVQHNGGKDGQFRPLYGAASRCGVRTAGCRPTRS